VDEAEVGDRRRLSTARLESQGEAGAKPRDWPFIAAVQGGRISEPSDLEWRAFISITTALAVLLSDCR